METGRPKVMLVGSLPGRGWGPTLRERPEGREGTAMRRAGETASGQREYLAQKLPGQKTAQETA